MSKNYPDDLYDRAYDIVEPDKFKEFDEAKVDAIADLAQWWANKMLQLYADHMHELVADYKEVEFKFDYTAGTPEARND